MKQGGAAREHSGTAITGRPETHDYLERLGARAFLSRADMSEPPRPLESETWAAAVDTVGSVMLAKILAQIRYRGVVAACGLAGGFDLPTTVMPFILRGVRLQGVDSVMAPYDVRLAAWQRLSTDLPRDLLEAITTVMPMSELIDGAPDILAGEVRGRVVVDVNA